MFYIARVRDRNNIIAVTDIESFGIRDRATRGNKRERAVVARKQGYPKQDGTNED